MKNIIKFKKLNILKILMDELNLKFNLKLMSVYAKKIY